MIRDEHTDRPTSIADYWFLFEWDLNAVKKKPVIMITTIWRLRGYNVICKGRINQSMSEIEGQVITDVRTLSSDGHDGLTWTVDLYNDSLVLELGDGSMLIPMRDSEGNAPGVFHAEGVDDWSDIVGSMITDMSPMSTAAMEYRGWGESEGYRPPVISLDAGEQLYPSADPEENHLGMLFRVQNSETFIVDFETDNSK